MCIACEVVWADLWSHCVCQLSDVSIFQLYTALDRSLEFSVPFPERVISDCAKLFHSVLEALNN